MRKIISLFVLLLPVFTSAETLAIKENAPNSYVVVKGDTLWDISARFYAHPWQWTTIWGLNKDTIKNPHWIYPGDFIHLDRATGALQVTPNTNHYAHQQTTEEAQNSVIKLSPQIHVINSEWNAIPAIPLKVIEPFLARPLVIDDVSLAKAPKILGGHDRRKMLSANDVFYVELLPDNQGTHWQIFRPGKMLIDPVSKETLGQEVIYLGDAEVEKFDKVSQLRITQSQLEILKGDWLAQPTINHSLNYQPHAPSLPINAQIISVYGGLVQAGQNAVISLNKGQRDGLENGHVLALYQKGEKIKNSNWFKSDTSLPDVRYGLALVFRVFEKVSYALVLQSELPLQLTDAARTP